MGTKVDFRSASYMFFSNNLLAYIPGKLANAIGMATLARRRNISIPNTITTVILFQIYSLISGTFLISFLSFRLSRDIKSLVPLEGLWIIGLASAIGLLLISPICQSWTINLIRKITGKDIIQTRISLSKSLLHITFYGIGWFISGFSMCFLLRSFGPDDQIIPVTSVLIILLLSYLIGLLAITVPAGIGVLEASLIYGLSTIVPTSQVLFSAGSFRLIALGTTLISWLVVSRLNNDKYDSRNY